MKKMAAIILFPALILAAAACNSSDTGTPGSNAPDNSTPAMTSPAGGAPDNGSTPDNGGAPDNTPDSGQNNSNGGEETMTSDKPIIALTFDDGPNTTNSIKILDELEARGIVATYFVIGSNINDQSAEVMKRAYALGCEYANHSWGWDSLGNKSSEAIIESIINTSEKIVEVLGEDAYPKFFRAPNLNTSADMIETVKGLGFPLMNGIMGNDWESSATPESIFNLVVSKVQDGSIILLHDGGSNNATAEGIGAILDALLDEGFEFVTLSRLFEIKGTEIEPGKTYNSVS